MTRREGPPHAGRENRIEEDRIVAVGNLRQRTDEPVIDDEGLVLAPGFIDTHSHADSCIDEHRTALAAKSQGITTVVVGKDGSSELPLVYFFADLGKRPAAVNVASSAGHGTLRDEVMGADFTRPATPEKIAVLRGTDPAVTLIDLIRESEALHQQRGSEGEDDDIESIIAVRMKEADIEDLMGWRFINICTDGELQGPHPRGFGSFPRVLGRYVRDRQILSPEQVVRSMTSQVVANAGLQERGRIEPGAHADIVLFDPDTVVVRATMDEPHVTSTGIDRVCVGQRPSRLRRRTPERAKAR